MGLTAFSAALSFAAVHRGPLPGDLGVSRLLRSYLGQGWLAGPLDLVSYIHEPAIIGFAIAFAAFLAVRRRWLDSLSVVLLVATVAGVPLLKDLIGRPRPTPDLVSVIESGRGYSFPSGHTFVAVTLLGVIAANAPTALGAKGWVVVFWRASLVTLIAAMAVSRVYLGAHWPSDVVGSVSIGLATLMTVGYVVRRLQSMPPKTKEGNARKRRGAFPIVRRARQKRGKR